MGVWVAGGAAPCVNQAQNLLCPRARRAGRRSRRARRAQASAGSASRAELGKGENRFEPSVSRIWQKQNVLVYVCDILYICFSLYYLYLVCHRAPTHGGLGCRGAAPAVSALRVYIKNQSKRCIACSAMKRKNNFDTKCTPLVLFVKRFEESLKGAHPKSQYA